jgi:hypothetical protein
MSYKYKVYYSIVRPLAEHQRKDHDMVVSSPTPIRALDIFHKTVQTLDSKSYSGAIVRPKLMPEEYVVTSLVQVYANEVRGHPMIEGAIDLPRSANPDLSRKDTPATEANQDEMNLGDPRKSANAR